MNRIDLVKSYSIKACIVHRAEVSMQESLETSLPKLAHKIEPGHRSPPTGCRTMSALSTTGVPQLAKSGELLCLSPCFWPKQQSNVTGITAQNLILVHLRYEVELQNIWGAMYHY